MSITNPPGYQPDGYDPPGYQPDDSAPIEVRDLDSDLFDWLKPILGFAPSPLYLAPGPSRPTVVYTLVAEVPTMRLAGAAGLTQRTYQLDFRSTVMTEASALAERCRLASQGFRGLLGTNQVRAISYRRIPTALDRTTDTPPGKALYRVAAEVRIWFVQAIPTL